MCTVTITLVEGLINSVGGLGSIRVTGTATDCAEVRVQVVCRANPPAAPLLFTVVNVAANNTWEAIFDPSNANFHSNECQCGGYVAVHAFCTADPQCESFVEGILECRDETPDCPTIQNLTANVGQCNADGTVTVTTTASVSPGAVGPAFVQWTRDGNPGPAQAVSNPNTPVSDTFNYPGDGAPHTAALTVVHPPDCPSQSTTFNTPACNVPPPVGCPTVQFASPVISEGCNDAGRHTAMLSAIVTPAPGNNVSAELVDDATGTVLDSRASAVQFILSATRNYLPGTHTVTVRITSPPGCGSATDTFDVPPCPGTEGCPVVEITVGAEGPCDSSGRRAVTITARVTPAPGSPASAELLVDGMPVASQNNSVAPFDLTDTRGYPSGPHSVSVNVLAPAGCGPAAESFQISPCPPPDPVPPPEETDDSFGCLIGRWLIVFLIGLAFFLLFMALCIPGAGTGLLIAAGVTLALAIVLLIIWWIFCGDACGLALLLWQACFVVGVVAIYISGCCPWLLFLGIGLLVLAVILFIVWVTQCKPSRCVILRELTAALVTGAGTALDLLGNFVPCGMVLVAVAVGGLAALATAITLAACVGRNP